MAPGIVHHEYYKRIIPLALILGIGETIIIGLFFYKYIDPIFYFCFYLLNYGLGYVIDPDNDAYSITLSEGIILRETKKFHIGFFGACHVSYWFIYAYLIGLVGGHRSPFSHSWGLGTVLRIIYFNIPLVVTLSLFCNFAIIKLGWQMNGFNDISNSLFLNWWVAPYLLSQFTAWFISDGMHLILDTEWAKYRLYTPVTHHKEDL